MKIIAIANSKGGVGKTTIACNLATALAVGALEGPPAKVLFIDTDQQKSGETFFADRAERLNKHDVTVTVKTNAKGLAREIKATAAAYDFVIIDAGGSRDSEVLRQVLLAAEAVITPTLTSQFDIDSLNNFMAIVDEVKGVNEALASFILLNRTATSPFDATAQEIREGLQREYRNDATVLNTNVRTYAAWTRLTDGIAIFEDKNATKAAQDLYTLMFELQEEGVI